jgi:hypothetical protein
LSPRIPGRRNKEPEGRYTRNIKEDDISRACSMEMRNVYRILVQKMKGWYHLKDLGIDRKIILKFILRKYSDEMWTGIMCLRLGNEGGFQSTW